MWSRPVGNVSNLRIAQKVANRSEDVSLNDIRSYDETKGNYNITMGGSRTY